MKYLRIFVVVLLAASFIVSCKPAKEMTPEDFLNIENKILTTDLTPESKEAVAKEFGFTLEQYKDFEEKVETDLELKAKVGELRLNMQRK